jgi:hypothetical protein
VDFSILFGTSWFILYTERLRFTMKETVIMMDLNLSVIYLIPSGLTLFLTKWQKQKLPVGHFWNFRWKQYKPISALWKGWQTQILVVVYHTHTIQITTHTHLTNDSTDDVQFSSTPRHNVEWGKGIPKKRNEDRIREVWECEGWVCESEVIGSTSLLRLIRDDAVWTRIPTLDLNCE